MDRNSPGIYLFENAVNGKKYVGSAVNIWKRARTHKSRLRKGNHENGYFQSSWNKYGENNFTYRIVENCPVENLEERENFWIGYYGSDSRDRGYNLCPVSGSTRGYKFTDDQRKHISDALKGKYAGSANPFYGKRHTEETKKILSGKAKGRITSAETKQKMRDSSPHLSGEQHPMWNRKHGEDAKRKMVASSARAKINLEIAEEIRIAHTEGETQAELARRHGITAGAVWKIIKGTRWIISPSLNEGDKLC